jgi:hypothetical protein
MIFIKIKSLNGRNTITGNINDFVFSKLETHHFATCKFNSVCEIISEDTYNHYHEILNNSMKIVDTITLFELRH